MKQWEEALADGELAFNIGPETTSINSSRQNHLSTTTNLPPKDSSKQNSTYSSAGMNFSKSFGDVDDFRAFMATGLDLDTQQEIPFSELLAGNLEFTDEPGVYPAPDALSAPTQPYFGDSLRSPAGFFGVLRNDAIVQTAADDGTFPEQFDGFTDFLQGHANPEDQRFWDEIQNGPPLTQSEYNHACHQATHAFQDSHSNKVWDSRPALDELPPPEASASLLEIESAQSVVRPPPLPLHSKPVTRPQQIPSQPHTPIKQSAEQGSEELFLTPQQKSRKRTASLSLNDSTDDGVPSVSHLEKKQKIQECATRMAYVQGIVKHIEPGQTLNARTTAIHQFDPSKVYDPLPAPPTNWSVFKYTAIGELETGRLYTSSEIHEYLYSNPLHTLRNGIYDTKNSGLHLLIQRNPADSARRYPTPSSNRCRFISCFATHNVINQGHIRVCFDEQSHLGHNNNPFHATAYVHLNCLERFLDFPALCRDLSISPETRTLPHEPRGRNRMLLAPESLTHIAFQFLRACERGTLRDYPANARPHEGTLTWRLMSNKVEEENHILKRQATVRGGVKASQVYVHLGDLEVESRVRDKTRRAKYQVRHGKRETEARKRKRGDEEWESEVEEVEVEEKPRVKRKYTKRNRK
ncbi:MAG: hypothetical protein LQ343_002595 [Gyalolechia ehrenbergii]|nr:MAG: hypothetical protein LQ343_002595 [Gyalolechia ehrenbergii]